MLKHILFAAAAIGALAAPVHAQAKMTVDADRLVETVRTLASDTFEGRAPGTRGEERTLGYLIARLEALGLEPAGPDGQWLQKVPLLHTRLKAPRTLDFATPKGKVSPRLAEDIYLSTIRPEDAARVANAPLVFVGYGVKAPERGWDDFKGVDLKGKIMVVLVNDPDFEGGEGDFGGKLMTYYGRWTYKYEEAARQGAAGVLVVHESEPASYGWATVKNSNTNTMFDIVRADPKSAHTQMEGWIQKDLAAKLLAASGVDFEAAKAAARKKDFKPIALKATMSADYAVKSEIITSHNVAGILPGSKYPDETVIYSAHWDHLGIGAPDAKGDTIYNGARDNASGTAALLELARAYAKGPKPERSVLFLAVTAEEKGLLGSEYYADNPLRPLATTAGVVNMDGPFAAEKTVNFSISGAAKLDLLTLLTQEGEKLGRHYTPDARPEAGSFYRSDHFPMAKRGVPAISFNPGRELVNGGAARGKELGDIYTRDRYHQPADQYDDSWNTSSWEGDMTLLYNVGRRVADGHDWPNWSSDSEFRAARDASQAQRK